MPKKNLWDEQAAIKTLKPLYKGIHDDVWEQKDEKDQ